ncbi:MAG: phosphate acyltransferase PlsX [Dehalococcoidia bacterium]|nr:MAG: phosphate acyltransferase PlsX [Dehalococcoidia bacterium]
MQESGTSGQMIRVAVDVMGGDYAPTETVKGGIQAARELGVEIILVGPMAFIEAEFRKHDAAGLPIRLVDASEVIADGEHPVLAVMKKPNSSVSIATKLVQNGDADAMVSAGSTGACMVCAMQYLGTLPGIDRPMAGGPFLQLSPETSVFDMGVNVYCQPEQLVNFAVAGCVFTRAFLGIENPSVGLLNVGSEEGKGNQLAKEAYPLLQKSGLNFIGNVEGMDIPKGSANVIVCDGFVGNILLKFCEGLGETVRDWLLKELKGDVPQDKLEEVTTKLWKLMSPGAVLGGAPLWGVDGLVMVCHGSSHAPQIAYTINEAKACVESGFIDLLRSELEKAQALIWA